MSGNGTPTYDQLETACEELQKQVTLSLKDKQDLIDARNDLDRDLARFKAIQTYSQDVIHAKSFDEFARITVESIAAAFELECSAFFLYDAGNRALQAVADFGFETPGGVWLLDAEWIDAQGLWRTENARVERVEPGDRPWGAAGLCQAVVCPFHDHAGDLRGLVLGGISAGKKSFYDVMDEKLVPSFTVFTQQMGSLLHNLDARETIRRQVEALREKTDKLQVAQESLQESNVSLSRTVKELSSLHNIGTALMSILGADQLIDTVLQTVVHDLIYDRAMILLVDEKRSLLTGGRIIGADGAMKRYVENLELPVTDGAGVLSQVAFSGNPILVRDAQEPGLKIAADVVAALRTRYFLAVPLKAKGKVIGVIAVDNDRSDVKLGEDDIRLLSILASQVAIAIENARLYDGMETRVAERTAELSRANTLLKQEVVERTRVERELQEAKKTAEDASRAKSEFLSNMSHELRTPMNAVIGFSEMVLDGIYGDVSKEIREVVGEIQKSGEHLLGLINDVLDISKIRRDGWSCACRKTSRRTASKQSSAAWRRSPRRRGSRWSRRSARSCPSACST